jgi:hypothetical protein
MPDTFADALKIGSLEGARALSASDRMFAENVAHTFLLRRLAWLSLEREALVTVRRGCTRDARCVSGRPPKSAMAWAG